MRVVRNYKTALSRQIGGAVRMRRRGGAGMILNSKSEYSHSKIPRLVLKDLDEEHIKAEEEREAWNGSTSVKTRGKRINCR